ncbi:replication-associated recombination protein A [Aeromicrobium duanguangcaii]|uniref:replication-associated recombination protein A n=1 Tax=Aeromicrobium duanguangcaii TaxID=2968086 RepID=UPI0020176512|nr:replication-associated recombination protein A [Aeromicrobium duanguangcaii]MCL3836941.1 replication-associated recombination protein A [Aeromicrobium duanguangcaii]
MADGLFDLPDQAPSDSRRDSSGSLAGNVHSSAPLAVRMRPQSLDELVGQQHLLAPGSPLRRMIEGNAPLTVLLWGPPGTGKTTLASLISHQTDRRFVEVSAVSAGVKEVREVIAGARQALSRGKETVLFVDEVHRFSKAQQDALLPGVENRWVSLVAATTENPHFSVISPLLSRSLLLTLQPLTDDDIAILVDRAMTDERGFGGKITISDEARDHLVRLAGGDGRRVLTYLEAAAGAASDQGHGEITLDDAALAVDKAAVRYDRQGDQHYDVTSAFIKSIRGSDVDAALHYLARMIEAGEDPRFIARRLMIHASEDIGMADPTALPMATATAQAVAMIGFPEARIPLAQAVIHLATAPKSNAVIRAIDAAMADVRAGKVGAVPPALRDAHYAGAKKLGHGHDYVYPHDDTRGVVPQQYAPDDVDGSDYYEPGPHGAEGAIAERLARIRAIVRDR